MRLNPHRSPSSSKHKLPHLAKSPLTPFPSLSQLEPVQLKELIRAPTLCTIFEIFDTEELNNAKSNQLTQEEIEGAMANIIEQLKYYKQMEEHENEMLRE